MITNFLQKYGMTADVAALEAQIEAIRAEIPTLKTREVLLQCFSLMDLTTLKTDDTEASVAALVERVNAYAEEYPEYPLPASVCVYSNFASVVASTRKNPALHATVVSACFPTSQSFLEVKTLEVRKAVEHGADEVDIVLNLCKFLAGDYDGAAEEIKAVKSTIESAAKGRKVVLKVILETGLLPSAEQILSASFLAMEAGADFIKTSTGKVSVNATPIAAALMCSAIKAYHASTGKIVGFKPAGGLSTADDAVLYYNIVAQILGPTWLSPATLRFGVSRMANNLLSAIEGKELKKF